MQQIDFFQLNTLVRVRENTLLSAQQQNALLRAADLDTAFKLLTDWKYFLYAEPSSPREFSKALLTEKKGWLQWAGEFSADCGIAAMFTLSDIIHNLKVFLKEQITGRPLEHLKLENARYRREDFLGIFEEQAQAAIPPRWKEQALLALEDCRANGLTAWIDYRMDALYYSELADYAAQSGDADIAAFVAAMVDLYHLSVLLQARIAKLEIPAAAIVKGGDLKDAMPTLILADADKQDAFLLGSRYAAVWEKAMQDARLFDCYADDYLMTLCKRAKLQAFGLFPLFAFLFAKSREIKTIRLILFGKSRLLPEKEIEKRVCVTYEL